MNVSKIASRTKIVALHCGAWSATGKHNGETEAVNAKHGTTDAARVGVKFCRHPALASLAEVHRVARAENRRLTRPTVEEGMRLLPLAREFEHAQAMADLRRKHEQIVAQFMADYESERAAAPCRLGGLYDARKWPEAARIERKFRFAAEYLPCPTEGAWSDWLAESAEAGELELRESLEAALRRVAERCASDGKLYSSVFGNLRELLALVPDLNLTDDPLIAAAARAAANLADLDAETVRERPVLRRQAAEEAARLASMFGGLAAAPEPQEFALAGN